MKFLVLSVFLLGCALAEEAPYPPSGTKPQGALLVLPTEVGSASQYSAPQYLTPQPEAEVAENLQKASENIMERLRKEQGSDSGNYYVYLADGRLQRVQYTTAPLRQPSVEANNQQVNLQNSQTFQNSNTLQFNQQNAQVNGRLQAFSQKQSQSLGQYVQQPYANNQYQGAFSNQYQPTASSQYSQQQTSDQYSQQYRQQQATNQYNQEAASNQYRQQPATNQYNQEAASNQYRQQPATNQYNQEAASNQYNQQVPSGAYKQQQPKPEKFTQPQEQNTQNFAQQPNAYSSQYSKVSVQGAASNENSAFPQQQQQYIQLEQQQYVQQPLAANYLASVQYTEVQPIASPIYSYSPAPLVRILRYAPMYQ